MFIGWRLFFVSVMLFVPFFSWAITRIVKSNQFDDNFTYHVQEALDHSATIEIKSLTYSEKQMELALAYLESNKLTSGWTTISGRTKSEDLSVFHDDIKKKYDYILDLKNSNTDKLQTFKDYVSFRQLKRSEVVVPDGISIYPHNTFYLIWFYAALLSAILGIVGMVVFINGRSVIR